jgi:hypothetical protein
MFTVEIQKRENVRILKGLIKEEKFPHLNHIAASDLDLWKVSQSFLLRGLGRKDVNIDDCLKLPPGEKLSVFEDVADNCLHVIAKAPTRGEFYLDPLSLLFQIKYQQAKPIWSQSRKNSNVCLTFHARALLTALRLQPNVICSRIVTVRRGYIDWIPRNASQPRDSNLRRHEGSRNSYN